jgi:hypothetical protein
MPATASATHAFFHSPSVTSPSAGRLPPSRAYRSVAAIPNPVRGTLSAYTDLRHAKWHVFRATARKAGQASRVADWPIGQSVGRLRDGQYKLRSSVFRVTVSYQYTSCLSLPAPFSAAFWH